MADKKQEEFVVQDRRRFSFEDGEVHDNPERAAEEPQQEQSAAAPSAPEPKKADVREFPKRETLDTPEPPPEVPQEVIDQEAQAPPLSANPHKRASTSLSRRDHR